MFVINCFIIFSVLEFYFININIFLLVELIRTCYNESFMFSFKDNRKIDRLKNDWSFFLF